jgi:hypothetical protein
MLASAGESTVGLLASHLEKQMKVQREAAQLFSLHELTIYGIIIA